MKNQIREESESYIHFFTDDGAWVDYDNTSDTVECLKQFISENDDSDYGHVDYLFLGEDALTEMPTDYEKRYAIAYDVRLDEYTIQSFVKINLRLEKVKWYLAMFNCDTGFMSVWDMEDAQDIDLRKTKVERTQTVEVWCDSNYDALDFYMDEIEDEDFCGDEWVNPFSYEEV